MNGEFPYIVASGSAFQMGLQNGKQSETLIKKHLLWIERLTGLNRNVLRANAMRFLPYIERFSSKYAEEISGLAEGARIPLADAMLWETGEWAGVMSQTALTPSARWHAMQQLC